MQNTFSVTFSTFHDFLTIVEFPDFQAFQVGGHPAQYDLVFDIIQQERGM